MPFEDLLPPELMDLSGSVYYSGPHAFSSPSPLYVLGINPGGDAEVRMAGDTIASHLEHMASEPARWSAYVRQSWDGLPPGAHRLQRRMVHLLDSVGHDPSDVPASNLVFARSAREGKMAPGMMDVYSKACWPFHAAVIETLGVRVLLCFGGKAGRVARLRLDAHHEIDRFTEDNDRHWVSTTHIGPSGIQVVTLAHGSVADWIAPATDPSELVARALASVDREPPPASNVPRRSGPDRPSRSARREPVLPPTCANESCAQIYQAHPGECW